jgi:RNA polymerase sigma-70 factor, ECF subfamily
VTLPETIGEQELIIAAVRGDAEAVRALWQMHRRWVAAVVLAHKPREADLEDLLQDVAMTLVRSISTLRDAAVLRPWLRTVAINTARAAGRQQTRRQARDRAHALAIAEPVGASPAEGDAMLDEGRRLLALAGRLPEGYREPLLLRCVRGMSYRQIAELTGLPESTIETRIARGRRMLRELAADQALDATDPGEESHGRSRGEGAIRP